MAFHRFIQKYLKYDIPFLFKDIFESIETLDQSIDHDTIYIDGTKLEANANKFTFIWKKTAIKTRDNAFIRLNECIKKLGNRIEASQKDERTIKDIENMIFISSSKRKSLLFMVRVSEKAEFSVIMMN